MSQNAAENRGLVGGLGVCESRSRKPCRRFLVIPAVYSLWKERSLGGWAAGATSPSYPTLPTTDFGGTMSSSDAAE